VKYLNQVGTWRLPLLHTRGQRWPLPIRTVRKPFLLTLTVTASDSWVPEVSELPLNVEIMGTSTSLPEIAPVLHHHQRHSHASMTFSPRAFLSGVIVLFAVLKTRSHSVAIAGQDSDQVRRGEASCRSHSYVHQSTNQWGSNRCHLLQP
jgi:hypothetical protein